jgi:RHS repeat-associated protein
MGRMATLSSTYGSANYISGVQHRAFGAPKQISYGNSRTLAVNYDNRLRPTRWDVPGVLGSDYEYRENTFRTTFARSRTDSTLDRWYAYDHVGRLTISRSGSEARAAYGEPFNGQYDGPYSMGIFYDVWGNITRKEGWGGWNPNYTATFNNKNQMTTNPGLGTAMQYDAAGNMTNDGWQSFTYDATGAQVQAPAYGKWQGHDGDGLRVKDVQSSATYYLRSTAIGGQVVAEVSASGTHLRGYVYAGEQLIAVQSGANYFVHQDPITKSQRITDASGAVVEAIELDPFGGETNRSTSPNWHKQRYTTWERDWTGDESMFRRYHGWWSRFAHPDPSDGSYNSTDPQSLNRYAYVGNDPVNFTDPSGLLPCAEGEYGAWCSGGGYWGPRSFAGNGWGNDPRPGLGIINERWTESPVDTRRFNSFDEWYECVVEQEGPCGEMVWSQDQLPITIRYMNDRYREDFLRAFREAEKRLENDKCARLFGGKDAALATLRATEYRVLPLAGGGPKIDPNTGSVSVTGAQTNSKNSVFINSLGPFFNNRMFVPGKGLTSLDLKTGLTGAKWGALLLLHELGHQAGKFGKDADDYEKNRGHSMEVYRNCF